MGSLAFASMMAETQARAARYNPLWVADWTRPRLEDRKTTKEFVYNCLRLPILGSQKFKVKTTVTYPATLPSGVYAPNSEARTRVLQAALKGTPGAEKVAIERIANKTDGFSPADLKALAARVLMQALSRNLSGNQNSALSTSLFEEALKDFAPSTKEWLTEARLKLRAYAKDESFSRLFSPVFAR